MEAEWGGSRLFDTVEEIHSQNLNPDKVILEIRNSKDSPLPQTNKECDGFSVTACLYTRFGCLSKRFALPKQDL